MLPLNTVNYYYYKMYPTFRITDLDKEMFPTGLKKSGLINMHDKEDYLNHGTLITDSSSVHNTCTTILNNGIRFAAFNLAVKQQPERELKANVSFVLSNMLKSRNCLLEYLNMSHSNIKASELIQILENPVSLKCIYIGTNDWSLNDLTTFYHFLQRSKLNTLVLGLHNLLVTNDAQSYTWNALSYAYPEMTKYLDNHNLDIAPEIDLDFQFLDEEIR